MNQDLALEILLSGESAFLTGAAGAGKTFTLGEFIDLSRKLGKKVAVTATTGLAATQLGGNTIHSWSGLGILDELPPNFFAKFGKTRAEQIRKTNVLVIDEISMLHDWQLDLVNQITKKIRDNDEPFGDLQIVFSGDFFQLPPVKARKNVARSNYDGVDMEFDDDGNQTTAAAITSQTDFAYNSQSWHELDPTIIYLEQNFRQNDQEFLTILNKIRENKITRADADKIAARFNAPLAKPGQAVTELYTTNRDVDRINRAKMAELKSDAVEYAMTTTGSQTNVDKLKKSALAQEKLELKLGALVMALKNDPSGNFANGSTGTVVDFNKDDLDPVIEFRHSSQKVIVHPMSWELRDGDKTLATLTQIPLRPAYAITVHKSQGMTLDAARINLRNVFEPGMGYVALSRVRGLQSLSISGLSSQAFFVHPEVLAIDKIFRQKSQKARDKFAPLLKNKTKREHEIAKINAQKSRFEKIRNEFPNAGKRWSSDEYSRIAEIDLVKFAHDDKSAMRIIVELSEELGRSPGSIVARISATYGPRLFAKLPKISQRYLAKRYSNQTSRK